MLMYVRHLNIHHLNLKAFETQKVQSSWRTYLKPLARATSMRSKIFKDYVSYALKIALTLNSEQASTKMRELVYEYCYN